MNIENFFNIAKKTANYDDDRTFKLGAVGIRSDGVIVSAKNGNSFSTKHNSFIKNINSHAEGRLLRKLDCDSIIFVVRLLENKKFAIAKPCDGCSCMIRGRRIEKVYYTIDEYNYGLWQPKIDRYSFFKF